MFGAAAAGAFSFKASRNPLYTSMGAVLGGEPLPLCPFAAHRVILPRAVGSAALRVVRTHARVCDCRQVLFVAL